MGTFTISVGPVVSRDLDKAIGDYILANYDKEPPAGIAVVRDALVRVAKAQVGNNDPVSVSASASPSGTTLVIS